MGILNNLFAILMVVFGLGFVIFIHELGHFLLAKWNGVKVEKFAIGFDIYNLKLFSRKYGETTYVLGALPLGGYVKMLGEDQTGTSNSGPPISDPRAYPNKPVGARMAIISAGVVMNILFGLLCFAYLYTRGKLEIPPVLGAVMAGAPAYEGGLLAGDRIVAVNDRPIQKFSEIQQSIIFNSKGQPLKLTVERPGEPTALTLFATPGLREGGIYQTIGVVPATDLSLAKGTPFLPPAGMKSDDLGPLKELKGGGTVIAAGPVGGELRPVKTQHDFDDVLSQFIDAPIEVSIRGTDENLDQPAKPTQVVLPPVRFMDLGLRLTAGPVASVQPGSPAEKAGLHAGDTIMAVNGQADYDPIRLPDLAYARAVAGEPIQLEVERASKPGSTETLTLAPRPVRSWIEGQLGDEPLDIVPLGFALQIKPRVASVVPDSPGARAGLKAGDLIHSVTFEPPSVLDDEQVGYSHVKYVLDGNLKARSSGGLMIGLIRLPGRAIGGLLRLLRLIPAEKPTATEIAGTWASVLDEMQRLPLASLKIQLAGSDDELSVTPTPVEGWFYPQRGLQFLTLTRRLPPQSIPSALQLAWGDTVENASQFYYIIRGLAQRTLSKDSVGGPVKIAKMAYDNARIGAEAYLPFLASLSINLAVVNFLPIPPLDGGQLLFLICEKVRGRPVPEKYAGPVMLAGLLFILLLFVVVNLNDLLSVLG